VAAGKSFFFPLVMCVRPERRGTGDEECRMGGKSEEDQGARLVSR
jgi:hypothetical protein